MLVKMSHTKRNLDCRKRFLPTIILPRDGIPWWCSLTKMIPMEVRIVYSGSVNQILTLFKKVVLGRLKARQSMKLLSDSCEA